jgi:hypothetical protein
VSGQETINGKTVYLHREASCLVDPRTMIRGTATAIRAVLQRGPSPSLPSRLQPVIPEVDFSQPIELAALPAAWPSAGPGGPPAAMGLPFQLQQLQRVVLHGSMGADLVLSAKLTCSDANTANGLKGVVDLIKMPKLPTGGKVPPDQAAAMQVMQSLSLVFAGFVLTANLTVPVKVLLDAVRARSQQPNANPFGVKKS